MQAKEMQKLFKGMTENVFAKITSVLFLIVFVICVGAGGMGIDWLSWFIGIASGLSIWKLFFGS